MGDINDTKHMTNKSNGLTIAPFDLHVLFVLMRNTFLDFLPVIVCLALGFESSMMNHLGMLRLQMVFYIVKLIEFI